MNAVGTRGAHAQETASALEIEPAEATFFYRRSGQLAHLDWLGGVGACVKVMRCGSQDGYRAPVKTRCAPSPYKYPPEASFGIHLVFRETRALGELLSDR